MKLPGGVPTGHVDQFTRSLLPPVEDWPEFDYSEPHLQGIPDRVNAAAQLLDSAIAEGFGDKPVYFYDKQQWTFSQLSDHVQRVARVLVDDFGLVPGNRVLLRSGNTPMAIACWLAVVRAGGICVATMPMLRAKELDFILDRGQIRFALCDVDLTEDLHQAAQNHPGLQAIGCFTPLCLGNHDEANLDRLQAEKVAKFAPADTAADDIAVVSFTSGSTGRPKAVGQFHRDILASSVCMPKNYPVFERDIIAGSPSIAFTYGVAAFIFYPLRFRASAVLVSAPTPEKILKAIQRYRVTNLYTVPTFFNAMLQEVAGYDTSSLERCSSAGEHLQLKLWEQWREATGLRIVNGVGATEFMSHFLCDTPEVPKPGSSGKAVPGYTLKLVDEHGNEVAEGEQGQMAIRGPTGCRYLDDIERQRETVRNGWTVTSDVYTRDADGYYWFVDRIDDIIVSSGYNISPNEVEMAVMSHPEVLECAVIGVPDEKRGKLVRACVVLREPTRDEAAMALSIQEHVKKTVAPYKYPREVKFYMQLPRTPTGKIQRFLLRKH